MNLDKEIAIAQRAMDIASYLPPVIREINEMKGIAGAENPELAKLCKAIDGRLKDQFVPDATIHGVKRWEGILGISPKGMESLEMRKCRILARLNEMLPYTYNRYYEWLEGVCRGEKFRLNLHADGFLLTMRFYFYDTERHIEIYKEARKIIPANLGIRELAVLDGQKPIQAVVGIHTSIALRAEVEPYHAGSHESIVNVPVCIATKVGLRMYLQE